MSAEIAALAQRVATARGKLPLQTDPALFDEMSESEIAAERDLAEWIRAQRRRQRRGAVAAELAAEKRDRRVERALRRADDADARWHRKALAARRRVSNPDARLAQLYRRAEWSSRALIGVVVLGMVWAGVNVQQNLVPSGDMSDPLYWLSYGFEAMISIPIITIMVVATTAARWGREIARGKVVFLEAALLGVTIALNAGPHLAGGAPARAAEAAVAPVMVGVVIWLHAWVSARYAQLIDAIPDHSTEQRRTVTHRIVDAFAPVRGGSGESRHLSTAPEQSSGPMLSEHPADSRGRRSEATGVHRRDETAAPPSATDHSQVSGHNGHVYPPDGYPAAQQHGLGYSMHPEHQTSYSQSARDIRGDHTHPADIAPRTNGRNYAPDAETHPTPAPSRNGNTHPSAANGYHHGRPTAAHADHGDGDRQPETPATNGFGNHPHDLPAKDLESNGFPTPSRSIGSNRVDPQRGTSPTTGDSGRNGKPAPRANGQHADSVAGQYLSDMQYRLGESAGSDTERVSPPDDEDSRSNGRGGERPTPATPMVEPADPIVERETAPGDDSGPAPGSTAERTDPAAEPDTHHSGPNGSQPVADGGTSTDRQHTGSRPRNPEPQGRDDSRHTAKTTTAAHPYARRPAAVPESAEPATPTDTDRPAPTPDVSKYRRPYAVVETEPEAAEPDSGEVRASAADLAAEIDNVGVWAVAREISERRLSKLPVEQLAEILTLADESWTPAAIGSSIGLPGSRILGILEAARRIRLPYAISG
ncbi:hypothetical protein [Nocardia thraciensis]